MTSKHQQWIDTIINTSKDEPLASEGELYNDKPDIEFHSVLPDRIHLNGEFKFWQLILIVKHMFKCIKEKWK